MNWKKELSELTGTDTFVLRDGIRVLGRSRVRLHPLALPEQPFDSFLLRESALYRLSRKKFLKLGGKFKPTVVSSPRTLTSPALLSSELEYTPIERELIWAATDPLESSSRRTLERLLRTRMLCTSLFHEQNHRILWRYLPAPSLKRPEVKRYLDTAESFVVALDMALGDALGHSVSRVFYLAGVTYDPGTEIRQERLSKRTYRNYLHACLYATYLKLQFFEDTDIRKVVLALYPQDPGLTERAIRRALRLDDDFVQITNPSWQKRHIDLVIAKLGRRDGLAFPSDPLKNHVHYLWAENWFEKMGL